MQVYLLVDFLFSSNILTGPRIWIFLNSFSSHGLDTVLHLDAFHVSGQHLFPVMKQNHLEGNDVFKDIWSYLWLESSLLVTEAFAAKKQPLNGAVNIAVTSGTVKQKLVIIVSQ